MTCHGGSVVGCTGLALAAPYRHVPISTTVAASIYTASNVPYAHFLPQIQDEAPQVVIEASHPSEDSHEFLYHQPPSPIPGLPETLTSKNSSVSAPGLNEQQVIHQDRVDFLGLMTLKRRFTIVVAAVLASFYGLDKVHDHLNPNSGWQTDEEKEEVVWIASSHSAFDRGACRWLGVCGASHIDVDPAAGTRNRKLKAKISSSDPDHEHESPATEPLSEDAWRFQDSVKSGRVLKDVPQYVLDYAPLVHLYSGEEFWPCDPAEHLQHTTPNLNYTPISSEHPTLQNLDALNDLDGGRYVFLKSDDNVEERPDWLGGVVNKPNTQDTQDAQNFGSSWADWESEINGPRHPDDDRETWSEVGIDSTVTLGGQRPEPDTNNPLVPSKDEHGDKLLHESETPGRRRRKRDHPNNQRFAEADLPKTRLRPGGRSSAPAVLILVEKSPDIIDAFWFYFYSYNLGNSVLNIRFGNHVGDWEHSLVRFQNGLPRIVFVSEHAGGKAFTYDAVEKIGLRPVIYSAEGTHAMYGTPGEHPYILPAGLLKDVTDKGPLWDPALNLHSYHYNYTLDVGTQNHDEEAMVFRPTKLTPAAPTNWFWFRGHWGDKFYQLSDKRQYRFLKEYHYVNGPLGPRFKHLGRKRVCQGHGECEILDTISGR